MMGHMFAGGWSGGNWDTAPDYMKQMMQGYYGGISPFVQFAGIAHLITWVVIMLLIIAAIRYLWKLGDKAK